MYLKIISFGFFLKPTQLVQLFYGVADSGFLNPNISRRQGTKNYTPPNGFLKKTTLWSANGSTGYNWLKTFAVGTGAYAL